MKIAILTLPLHTNYGGILQAYALQTVLQNMGHEVKIINYSMELPKGVMVKNACLRLFNKMRGNDEFVAVNLRRYLKRKFMRDSRITHFISRNIELSKEKYNRKETLESLSGSDFDAFIVGSDQVWRTAYVSDISIYFLSFIKDTRKKRIAYSASFGVDYQEYIPKQIEDCRQYFSLFDAVSVREESGLKLIEEYHWKCKTACVHTLDPTMLLEGSDYIRSFQLNIYAKKAILCAYILDICDDTNYIQRQVAMSKGLDVVKIESIDTFKIWRKNPLMSPVQWMEHIAASRFVVTDSFHGCVFSILFHKPFVVFNNSTRGSVRMTSLLRLLQLEERLVSSSSEFEERRNLLLQDIDYCKVDILLKEKRVSSLSFLDAALNK